MHPRELLVDTVAHIPPPHALEGLTLEQAGRTVPGATHSIAELVAHMTFWMEWFVARCEGRAEPPPATAAAGWPAAAPGDWPEFQGRFLAALERLVRLGEEGLDRPVSPPIEFPPLAHYTIGDALAHAATHNAHHLGQIITLRQIIGCWPPPSGSWTW